MTLNPFPLDLLIQEVSYLPPNNKLILVTLGNMDGNRRCDRIFGSGQGGVLLAADLAKEGRKVVLFERDALEGSCINYGCTSSKAFLAAIHTAERARKAKSLGIHTQVAVDFSAVTEPQVGRVGMTLEQAQHKGINARAVTLSISQIARAIEWGHDRGFYRMAIDQDTDKILGATLVGYETAELVHVFLSLMEAEAPWQLLEQLVHIHPTYGEALPSLARLFLGENMPTCPNM